MTIDSQLIEAVKQGHINEVKSLLNNGTNIRHDGDAALREAVLNGDAKMRELIMICYPEEATREEAVERVAAELTKMIDGVRKRHKELIARRILKELIGPPIEL